MANSQMIGTCEYCNQEYCQECTDAPDWLEYCSVRCETLAKKESEELTCQPKNEP